MFMFVIFSQTAQNTRLANQTNRTQQILFDTAGLNIFWHCRNHLLQLSEHQFLQLKKFFSFILKFCISWIMLYPEPSTCCSYIRMVRAVLPFVYSDWTEQKSSDLDPHHQAGSLPTIIRKLDAAIFPSRTIFQIRPLSYYLFIYYQI